MLLAVLVVGAGRAARPLVRARLARRGRLSFTVVFTAMYSTVVAVLGVLLAATLTFPSLRMVDVLGGLGIVSVAVGFAFKDILENLLAGVLLLLRERAGVARPDERCLLAPSRAGVPRLGASLVQ